jgi:predicted transcriptional regulator
MSSIRNVLYWLIANSVGGYNRGLILDELFRKPSNAHGLSLKLNIDYNTIRYHLDVLIKNKIIETAGSAYGKTYFIKDELIDNKQYFYEIWNDFRRKRINTKKE